MEGGRKKKGSSNVILILKPGCYPQRRREGTLHSEPANAA